MKKHCTRGALHCFFLACTFPLHCCLPDFDSCAVQKVSVHKRTADGREQVPALQMEARLLLKGDSWRPVWKKPCSRSRIARTMQSLEPEAAQGFFARAWPFSKNPAKRGCTAGSEEGVFPPCMHPCPGKLAQAGNSDIGPRTFWAAGRKEQSCTKKEIVRIFCPCQARRLQVLCALSPGALPRCRGSCGSTEGTVWHVHLLSPIFSLARSLHGTHSRRHYCGRP